MEKKCYYCKEIKDESKFNTSPGYLGLQGYCKDCQNTYKRLRTLNNFQYRTSQNICSCLRKGWVKFYSTGVVVDHDRYPINLRLILNHLKEILPEDYEPGKYSIDHIVPLSAVDLSDENNVRIINYYKNLQWLTREQNSRKSNKYNEIDLILLKYLAE